MMKPAGARLASDARWISVSAASRYLGIHAQSAYVMCADGRLPCARLGRLLRVDKVALDRLLEESARKGRP